MIIHISGPSGAGKSTLGKKLKKYYKNKIIVKDIDDLRQEFIKEYYGNNEWSTFNKAAYQKFIYSFISSCLKPLIFVGLNNMPFWHKNVYYDLRADHKFYINLANDIILKQKCLRYFTDMANIGKDKIAMRDLTTNNKKFLKNIWRDLQNECDETSVNKINNKWNSDYKKQKYIFMSGDDIYNEVLRILHNL
jgi:tRNA uridine 5-carbamoylmethylation protein Kti12